MLIYEIIEVDRDYNKETRRLTKEFSSESEARQWCIDESWSGYNYYLGDVK